MTSEVLTLENVLSPDLKATRLTEKYVEWESLRQPCKDTWEEIRRYIYATSTEYTTNSSLPWKNKTTIPKLCQIYDNLLANYGATLFPRDKSIFWLANEADSNSREKRDSITNYMNWVISQPGFKHELDKIIADYVQYGNCFATVEWIDERVEQKDKTQVGYVGPGLRRISPLDTVMNPTAENFVYAPKFVRSVISLGELKKYLESMSNDENREAYEELYDYLKNIRFQARTFNGDWSQQDRIYQMDGFSSYRAYLLSDYCEVLTYYGDWYDPYTDTFEKNRVITVVDRHKLINDVANPSFFGYPPIYHTAWRKRQDNLWGMGPLDNLIGMQYRIDHIENMKADIYDLVTYPVQKIKGFVEDFTWQPGEKIFVSEEGDVELLQPAVQVLQANMEIQNLAALMEEMAGAPKEAMGFRTPGEKTKYEVQSLENAAARIFQNKIMQFEELMLEPLLNAMLELATRNMSGVTSIKVQNDDFDFAIFQNLTVEDITGIGRIRPVAARHFAEQAQMVQNLTSLAASPLWASVQPHFSGLTLARILEDTFDLKEYKAMRPFVALAEQAQGQRMAQALQEQLHKEMMTASGMGDDFDLDAAQAQQQAPPQQAPTPQGA